MFDMSKTAATGSDHGRCSNDWSSNSTAEYGTVNILIDDVCWQFLNLREQFGQ